MRTTFRRQLHRSATSALAFAILASGLASTTFGQLAKKIEPLIEAHQGNVAVIIKNLKTGETFEHNGDQVMPTASLCKFPVMIEVYRQAEEGKIQLDSKIEMKESDKVPGSGILTSHFDPGTELTVNTTTRLMMRHSDNTATNLLLDQIGIASTAKLMAEMGLPETQIHSKVYKRDTSVAMDRSVKYGLGSTSAKDMLTLLEKLYAKQLVSEKASEAMLAHMASCTDDSQLKRNLPKSIKVYHKTGAVDDVRTDAGLFESPSGTLAMIVLTAKNKDTSWSENNEAEVLSGKIGAEAYLWFNPPGKEEAAKQTSLEIGAQGDLVKALQRTLNARMTPSPALDVDGDFGGMTEAVVEKFQNDQNLSPTGVVDAATWEKLAPILFEETAPPQPRSLSAKEPADPLYGTPFVSSTGWVVYDPSTSKVLGGARHEDRLDFASTTKMMTAWLVAKYADKHPEVLDERVTYSKRADETIGSTSDIRAGESITVRQALYGLMLPSGNDASVALAEHFGERLKPEGWDESRDTHDMFVAAMNAEAKALGMSKTRYSNPHGLTDRDHKSCCLDLAVLGNRLLESPITKEVVSTREYRCKAIGASGYEREVLWRNTNNLLGIEGYLGVKTGTTGAAGACLVSCSERDGKRLMVVVLGAAASASRYSDSRNLHRWGWQELSKQ